MRPPAHKNPKPAAVLLCFAGTDPHFDNNHILLVQRHLGLRKHSGHVAFPGGAIDPDDTTAQAAALRETREETNLDTSTLHILGELPELYLAATNYNVTPTVAWTPTTTTLHTSSPDEIDSAHWVPLHDLLNPQNRTMTQLSFGLTGPAFDLPHLYIWGFTAGLLSRFIDLAGFTHPWDTTTIVPLPERAHATLR